MKLRLATPFAALALAVTLAACGSDHTDSAGTLPATAQQAEIAEMQTLLQS